MDGSPVTSGSKAAPTPGGADFPCCCRGLALRRDLGLWHPLCLGGNLCPSGGSTCCCCWSSLGLTCSSLGSGTRCVQCTPAGLEWRLWPEWPECPPLLLTPLPPDTCLSCDVEAVSDDSLLFRFWLWAVLPDAATFSMRFSAILEYICGFGWTGSAQPVRSVCSIRSLPHPAPQISSMPSSTVAGASFFLRRSLSLVSPDKIELRNSGSPEFATWSSALQQGPLMYRVIGDEDLVLAQLRHKLPEQV
jgi:hypothetical protein